MTILNEHGSKRITWRPTGGASAAAPPVRFTFDGQQIEGRSGEPLTAVLFAAGIRVLHTMPRTGEARGGYCLIGRCTDCLAIVDGRPNVRACMTPVRAGMTVEPQSGIGHWSSDGNEVFDSPVDGPAARSAAQARMHNISQKTSIVIIGAGIAGPNAASSAARLGACVTLLDEYLSPLTQPHDLQGRRSELDSSTIDVRFGALVWGLFEDNVLGVIDRGRSYRLRPQVTILAAGATDRPFPFPGGSLPGVFTAHAITTLIRRDHVLPGHRFAVIGGGSEAVAVSQLIEDAGGQLVAGVDPSDGSRISAGGRKGVRWITINGVDHAVDIVVIAIGRQPDTALALMAGVSFGYDPIQQIHLPILDEQLRTSLPNVLVAGDAAGPCNHDAAAAEGQFAGVSAARHLGLATDDVLAEARATYDRVCRDRIAMRAYLKPTFVQTLD